MTGNGRQPARYEPQDSQLEPNTDSTEDTDDQWWHDLEQRDDESTLDWQTRVIEYAATATRFAYDQEGGRGYDECLINGRWWPKRNLHVGLDGHGLARLRHRGPRGWDHVWAAAEAAITGESSVSWRSVSDVFEVLPPTQWLAKALQLGPGRPAMIAGYGASLKTLTAQSLALSVMTQSKAWAHYPIDRRGTVLHFDFEQGFNATARRYQRLAAAMGVSIRELGDRLRVTSFPEMYLRARDAYQRYAQECSNASLVIIDSLRAACPGTDENSSEIREHLDTLTRVSEVTGAAFLVLHHAGKPKDQHSDPRTVLRGSSAIFDACGLVLVATRTTEGAFKVEQAKQPAEAEGAHVEPFALAVEDVAIGGDPRGGVRVRRMALDDGSAQLSHEPQLEKETKRVLQAVEEHPEPISQATLLVKLRMRKQRLGQVLDALVSEGRLIMQGGPRTRRYQVREVRS